MDEIDLQLAILQAPHDEEIEIAALLEYLRVQPGQQRPLDSGKARKIAQDFEPRSVGRLIVNRRADGVVWLIDGQHRAHAMRQKGITLALCSVFDGLSLQEEARLWVKYNGHHMPRGLALYHGALMAGEQESTEIDRIVQAHGYYVPRSSGATGAAAIAAVGALQYIYRRGSSAGLSLVLQIVREVWPGDPHAVDGKVLQGLFVFANAYRDEFTLKRLTTRLSHTPLAVIYRQAAAQTSAWGGRGQNNFAIAIVQAYNRGLALEQRLDPVKISKAS